jgi:uncharacterized membrane protein YhaH (DUF805 family)
MTFAQKLFSFQGRLRRREYWLLSLMCLGVMLAIYVLGAAMGVDVTRNDIPSLTLQLTATAVVLWPSLAVSAKRCHDRGQSARWLVLQFIPIVGGFWVLINLGILDGTRGRNRFGPSPKGIDGEADREVGEVFA